MWKKVIVRAACCALFVLGAWQRANAGEEILFVSDMMEPGNMDIYSMDVDTLAVRRLTTDPAIDNHPDRSPDGAMVAWSSTRNPGGGNPEEEFELFLATDDGSSGGLENGTLSQLTTNDYDDRHPHFNHDPLDMKIIYTAKYYCVATIEVIVVSVCSITHTIEIIDPCGRRCEAIRILDIDTSATIDLDHDMLTAADPVVWPLRPATDARWVGHPSFNEDGTQIIFSGAVDGEGRNWEVYVADWDGASVTGLRQVTDGSTYPDNPNPTKMNAGAIFSHDGSSILFTSTRTAFGNSQLFEVAASSDKVPASPAVRHTASSDMANDYVPHHLEDGRIVLTSDREDLWGLKSCVDPVEYTAGLNPLSGHTIRVEASGEKDPGSSGFRVHLDGYSLDGVIMEEGSGTTYSGIWSSDSSPNASSGYFSMADDGTSGEYVDIAVPAGTSAVELYLGRTPSSGAVRISIDGTPITDGNFELAGDPLGDPSGWNLYTPFMGTGNDLDLIVIDADGVTQTNVTDDDTSDEMLLIGDEVSWFCGLSPNVSLCTYIPKAFKVESLRWMMEAGGFNLPNYYPNRDLYPIAYQALDDFMTSGGNGLRPNNVPYWQNVLNMMNDPFQQFDDVIIVLPTPVNFHVDNDAPSAPGNPFPPDGSHIPPGVVEVAADPSVDPNGDPITYDIYLAGGNGPLLNVAADVFQPQATLQNVIGNNFRWRVVAKDSMGGLQYGPEWTFTTQAAGLTALNEEISAGTGGIVDFDLTAGPAYSNRDYALVGTMSGTSPGTPLPGGGHLPLNQDFMFNYIISHFGSPAFFNFLGTFDASGNAAATLDTMGPIPPLAPPGTIFNFAYTTLGPMDYQSNAVAVLVLP